MKDASPLAYKHEHEHANMNAWARPNPLKNIMSMSTKYQENILWHTRQNIWWGGKILCHMAMDEWFLWMKIWMKPNAWTLF
jgi:hypothetical protein